MIAEPGASGCRRLVMGLTVALTLSAVACGSSGGSTTPAAGGTAGGPTAGPTPTAGSLATVAPTAAPTATPTAAPTATPAATVLGTLGSIACTAPTNAVPGAYADVNVRGSVSGNTFTETAGEGQFGASGYAHGATPGPTAAPVVIPTPGTVTVDNALYIVYYGEYAVSALSGLTSVATHGCFVLVSTEPIGSTAGQSHDRGIASATPTPVLSIGEGTAAFGQPYPSPNGTITTGAISAFTIVNLTRTTGSGTFTLTTLANTGSPIGSGTVTITGSTAVIGLAELAKLRQRQF